MGYKDKDKQREAQRERTRRYRAKQKGVTSKGVTQTTIIPEQSHTDKVKDMLKAKGYPRFKPRTKDPDVQAIWDRRNAQGQAAAYSTDAKFEDYPQIQRPMRTPEAALADQV